MRPFTELTKIYSASPAGLTRGMDELESEGLILRKKRSGCHVTADAPSRLAVPFPKSSTAPAVPAPSADDAMRVHQPMRTRPAAR
jgi:DNA-binding transcriptional regulator YhcF (GntR family)